MKENIIKIQINRSLHEVFMFCIMPPNSTKWIPDVVKEETSEWPVKVGTIYRLQSESGNTSNVTVTAIKEDEFVEWVSEDKNYHCRYDLLSIKDNATELKYKEWVDNGEIEDPFTIDILEKLKIVIEK